MGRQRRRSSSPMAEDGGEGQRGAVVLPPQRVRQRRTRKPSSPSCRRRRPLLPRSGSSSPFPHGGAWILLPLPFHGGTRTCRIFLIVSPRKRSGTRQPRRVGVVWWPGCVRPVRCGARIARLRPEKEGRTGCQSIWRKKRRPGKNRRLERCLVTSLDRLCGGGHGLRCRVHYEALEG